jgi:hypothetical protein
MSDDYQVTLVMLVTEFKLAAGGPGEMFGFWYFNSSQVPAPKTPRDGFLPDLLEGRSCQLRVRGSATQIEAIVRTSAHVDARPADFSKLRMGVTVRLEDVGFPAGKSWGVNVDMRATETAEVIADKVRNRRDEVEMFLAPDWSLEEDLLQGFLRALL